MTSHDMAVDSDLRVRCSCGETSHRFGTQARAKEWMTSHRGETRAAVVPARELQMRNVKPGMVVLDEAGTWQTVGAVHASPTGWVTLVYGDGSEEEAPARERVTVAKAQ